MKKLKVVIATCYQSNEERLSFVLNACKKRKYDTKVYTTNYSHIKKTYRDDVPNGYNAIDTKAYIKNLSIARLLSHKKFAKDLFEEIEKDDPDLIWLMAPANSLIAEANKYKSKHPNTKIIIDIIDMWPESLPLRINKNIFPFNLWRNIRRNNINCADKLVTECDLYHDILSKEYHNDITTIHWARNTKISKLKNDLPKDKLSLCYIGSINNIIDTDTITKLISNCNKPVVLHVIGEGESRYSFVNINRRVAEVIYHGAIRNEKKKNEIFSKCHAGLNIYKNNLYIGLTVKSIDYFGHGLPVINNIKGDTSKLIDKYNIGFNVDENTILDYDAIVKMRKNNAKIYKVYDSYFTSKVFEEKCLKVIDEAIK